MCHQHRYWVDRTLFEKWLFIAHELYDPPDYMLATLCSPCDCCGVCDWAGHVCDGLPASCPAHILTPATHWPGENTEVRITSKNLGTKIWEEEKLCYEATILALAPLRATIDGKQCNIHRVILRVTICKKLQLAQKVSRWQESGSMRM